MQIDTAPERKPYILITGANGFIGSGLCHRLLSDGLLVKGTVRSQKSLSSLPHEVIPVQTGALGRDTQWDAVLEDVDTVIHLAGLAHRINKAAENNFAYFHSVNALGTECLAIASARARVRRFIYISSIGVNGEFTKGNPFTENDTPHPDEAYAVSKWEAEQALHKVREDTGMGVVILRPPLVYGAGAPGNFGRLMRIIKTGLPLPLGNIKNLHSFIYLGNLVDAIITCVTHPLAAGETFLVSDCADISTSDLIKMIASAMNKKPVLFSLHPGILKVLCALAGKTKEIEKMTGALLVDSSKIRKVLGWRPPFTIEEGIRATVAYYK